ncbi:hypothetical protein HK098_006753 [Nowakowskiella sp. JEL0407]|nr:hypothetical protein HK098_006753 [Nowakowskiella sp. JEL0407]
MDFLNRRAEMTKYLLLYQVCYAIPSHRQLLHGDPVTVMQTFEISPYDIQVSSDVKYAMDVFRALNYNLNYEMFARLWDIGDNNSRNIMQWVLPRVRRRILKILVKAYYTFPKDKLERILFVGYAETDTGNSSEIMKEFGINIEEVANGRVTLKVVRKR